MKATESVDRKSPPCVSEKAIDGDNPVKNVDYVYQHLLCILLLLSLWREVLGRCPKKNCSPAFRRSGLPVTKYDQNNQNSFVSIFSGSS